MNVEVRPSLPFQLLEQLFGPPEQQQQGGDAFARLARASQLRAAGSVVAATRVAEGPTLQARSRASAGLTLDLPAAREAKGWLTTLAKIAD